jgi:hypothetical protein
MRRMSPSAGPRTSIVIDWSTVTVTSARSMLSPFPIPLIATSSHCRVIEHISLQMCS